MCLSKERGACQVSGVCVCCSVRLFGWGSELANTKIRPVAVAADMPCCAVPCCAASCCAVQTADDMLCRALYALEGAWVHGFDPTTGNVRLDFEVAPNRGLFLALFRHAQVRVGLCSRRQGFLSKVFVSQQVSPILSTSGRIPHVCVCVDTCGKA